MDFENVIKDLDEEQLKKLKKIIIKKTKYKKKGVYREKENPLIFFTPDQWEKFIYSVNIRWRFYYWFLLLTGLRYNEAKHIELRFIDYRNKWITVLKPKGGKGRVRQSHLSNYAIKLIKNYKQQSNLQDSDTFKFPTIQHLIQTLKRVCKKQHIQNWKDYSLHNIRKTHENYLHTIGKDRDLIAKHMGHTPKVAQEYYISSAFIKDKKDLDKIRTWLGDIFQ